MKRNSFLFILIYSLYLFNCTAQVVTSLPLENKTLQDIDSYKLFEMNKKFEDNEYTEKTIKKHEKFISLLNKSQNDNEFLGKWELIDAKTKETVDKFSFYTGSSFEIQKYNSYLEYHCNSNMSFIYTDGKEFYFYPSVHFSFIKRMILINDELYFYILQDNNWILDPIHENGLYYYSKQ